MMTDRRQCVPEGRCRRRRLAQQTVRAILSIALTFGLAGCATSPDGPGNGPAEATPAPPDAPVVERYVKQHNRRIELLERLFAFGRLEFRWIDEEGRRHAEPQVDMRLWLEPPRRTSLRAEKLSEDILWLGSDDERYWLFDMTGEETVLFTGRHDEPLGAGEGSDVLIRPLALLDLIGLTPLPAPETEAYASMPIGVDADRDAWTMLTDGAGGPMRLFVDRRTSRLVRVESLTPGGDLAMFSSLGRPVSVVVPGVSRAALPKLPTLIDIGNPEGTVAIKLALNEPDAVADDQRWEVVFDLDRLREALNPDRIERRQP